MAPSIRSAHERSSPAYAEAPSDDIDDPSRPEPTSAQCGGDGCGVSAERAARALSPASSLMVPNTVPKTWP